MELISTFGPTDTKFFKKKWPRIEIFRSSGIVKCIVGFLVGNPQDIRTCMSIQTHPIIASQKRQPKFESCAKIGHPIKSCPSNFEIV